MSLVLNVLSLKCTCVIQKETLRHLDMQGALERGIYQKDKFGSHQYRHSKQSHWIRSLTVTRIEP